MLKLINPAGEKVDYSYMVNPNSKFLQKSTLDTPKILINDSMTCFLTFTKKTTSTSFVSKQLNDRWGKSECVVHHVRRPETLGG